MIFPQTCEAVPVEFGHFNVSPCTIAGVSTEDAASA
jgi:hypothetical protein